jgi:hypothetical protein
MSLFLPRNYAYKACPMLRAVKTLRAVQWVMLASVLACVVLGEIVGPGAHAVNPTLNYLFSTFAVAIIGVIFVVRRTLVFRAAESLATQPNDAISLSHWRTGYIVTYCLCECLALFGIVLRLLGCNLQQCVPFYFGGFFLLLFFRVRQPQSGSST